LDIEKTRKCFVLQVFDPPRLAPYLFVFPKCINTMGAARWYISNKLSGAGAGLLDILGENPCQLEIYCCIKTQFLASN
jgi:hypothetical protein